MKNTTKKIKTNSLYIHIPFCKNICSYCAFFKIIYSSKISGKYILNLIKDLKIVKEKFYKFKTIYIGGGTPSILSLEETEELLKNIYPLLRKNHEFTIEANLDSLDEDRIKLYKKYGVNRISIGIETFNNRLRKIIERSYDFDINSKIELVKKYFSNINLDLIYGLPNETLEELEFDLNSITKLAPKHISIYALEVLKGTKLYLNNYKEENDDILRKQYDFLVNFLKTKGYYRYEVSNFSFKNYESKHNINYWKDNTYLALGSGSSGYINNIRYKFDGAISKFNNGERNFIKEVVNKEDNKTYFLLTNLRMDKGFKLKDYKKRFNEDFYINKKDIIDDLIKNKIVEVKNGSFRIKKEHLYILDSIIIKLM